MDIRKGLGVLLLAVLTLPAAAQAPNGPVRLGGPEFDIYNPPEPFTNYSAAEPTLDINRVTGAAHMIYNNRILKTTWDDAAGISPAPATWVDNSDPVIQAQPNLDPFLVGVEHKNADGRFNPRIWAVSFKLATSQISYTDDDGQTWTPSFVQGQPAGVDNESMAAGPYPIALPITKPVFEQALYYCAHAAVNAFCVRSDDGGLSYGPGFPIFPANGGCSNHGHVKVGNDGTVYVPINNSCVGAEGVAVSTTAGVRWNYVPIPNTRQGRWDPGLAIANDGQTVYVGYAEQNDDRPMILKGVLNKSDPLAPTIDWDPAGAVDVGAPAEIANIAFSTVVAGDPDRAAYIFHGTTELGDSGNANFGTPPWFLYAAFTYDGGKTWTLRDLMPADPTQKGAICDGGIGCPANPPNRNLLDFMDAVLDAQGRVVVGFADGCVGDCVGTDGAPSYSRIGGIARQATGLSLFSEFDGQFKSATLKAPRIYARQGAGSVRLDWHAPKGLAPGSYRIYRAASANTLNESSAAYAEVTGTSFVDEQATGTPHYRVRAVRGSIVSAYSNEVASTSTEAFCAFASRSACYGPVRLARLEAAPRSGGSPLTVRFDARPSQQGLSDTIAAYHFDFGDGSEPVTDSDGLVEHLYTAPGAYRAGVTYTTASDARSGNRADVIIMVGPEHTATGLLGEKSGRGLLLGAGSPGMLLLMLVAVYCQSRRNRRFSV